MMRLLALLLLPLSCLSLSPSSHLTSQDKTRLASVFSSHLTLPSEVSNLHYAILGAKLLDLDIPDVPSFCTELASFNDESSVETVYLAAKAAAALSCPLELGPTATSATSAGLEGTTAASIFFAANSLVSTGAKLDSAKVSKALTAALKKDDSLLSLGLAFHTASLLDGDLSKFTDRIEDAVVQADEVDSKMLQFEGGLSVTSVVLTGAARLAVKAKQLLPVTGEQTVKFANYLMSRKSVQQVKGAFHLLEAVQTMAENPQFIPLSVSLASPIAVSADNPFVVVSVTNLAGGEVSDMELVLETATRQEDGAVVAAKQALVHMATTTKYTMDLMAANPPAGFYELVLTATPAKPDPRYIGNTGVVLNVKVLTTIEVSNAEVKIVDAEQSSDGRSFPLSFPNPSSQSVAVDSKEIIALTFSVLDSSKKSMLIHQAFVKLAHIASGSEIIYVAEPDRVDDVYKFELDLTTAAGDLNSKSGEWLVTVILGDAVITNPTAWEAVKLEINFPVEAEAKEASIFEPKPEIRHVFREPEARPPSIVSTAFTLLCLSPLLLMLGLWAKLGVNISNFQVSLAGVGFHLGLGSIFLLYTYFWLQLNMFQTVKYLVVLGVVTFLCGNSLLSTIAKRNKAAA